MCGCPCIMRLQTIVKIVRCAVVMTKLDFFRTCRYITGLLFSRRFPFSFLDICKELTRSAKSGTCSIPHSLEPLVVPLPFSNQERVQQHLGYKCNVHVAKQPFVWIFPVNTESGCIFRFTPPIVPLGHDFPLPAGTRCDYRVEDEVVWPTTSNSHW